MLLVNYKHFETFDGILRQKDSKFFKNSCMSQPFSQVLDIQQANVIGFLQVRSLTLDVKVWEPTILDLFRKLGNAYCNSVWEELLHLEDDGYDFSRKIRLFVFESKDSLKHNQKSPPLIKTSCPPLIQASIVQHGIDEHFAFLPAVGFLQ